MSAYIINHLFLGTLPLTLFRLTVFLYAFCYNTIQHLFRFSIDFITKQVLFQSRNFHWVGLCISILVYIMRKFLHLIGAHLVVLGCFYGDKVVDDVNNA